MNNRTVLSNGLRIISEKIDHYKSVSLGIWVNVGSREEVKDENGISHFIEHMIFKGTKNRTSLEIAKQLDAIGGFSNAFTGKEQTCFHAKVLDKHFLTLAEILSDIFLNSVFDPEEMDRERQVIFQEISMVEDTPDEQIHVLFNKHFWSNDPLGMSILGDQKTVSKIQKDTIINYINNYYTSNRIIIAAVGNIDHDQLVEYFQPYFKSISPSDKSIQKKKPRVKPGILCIKKKLEQVHICFGGEAPDLNSQLRYPCAILNTILGGSMSSRLFQEIREKRGLAYSLYSFLSAYKDTGLLGVYVGTNPNWVNDVLKIVNKEIGKILKGEVSETDLNDAKEHIIGGILLGSESTDSRMMRLARNEFIFQKSISYDELVSNLEEVTRDEVIMAAEYIFKNEKNSLVTLGSTEENELESDYLHFN